MSRDLRPCEVMQLSKMYPDATKRVRSMYWVDAEGRKTPIYTEDDFTLMNRYPMLGICGADLLCSCHRMGVDDEVLQLVEDALSGTLNVISKETMIWYHGKFCDGYYMDQNNAAFAEFLVSVAQAEEKGKNER